MLIEQYYSTGDKSSSDKESIRFTRQQGSDFAKTIAGDFNPLHDVDASRFCIPGDLLFAVMLANYGASQSMQFNFTGMVTEDISLTLPEMASQLVIKDTNEKEYLSVECSGETTHNKELIDNLTRSYVAFSGHTFPHILVPLLKQQNVMINPTRPMVMYQSMLIELDRLDLSDIELELDQEKTTLAVEGKRGSVCLAFNLKSGDTTIGHGEKHMIVSGLKPFEQEAVDGIEARYNDWKAQFAG